MSNSIGSSKTNEEKTASDEKSLSLDSVPSRVWQVTHELPETDETVLFDEGSSELLVLSDSGAAVWYLIDGRRSLREIIDFIVSEAPTTQLESAPLVLHFVETLAERGAVRVDSSPAA